METTPDLVSARTLQRERTARKEAESLLEQKSRELYEKNQFLQESELRYRNLVDWRRMQSGSIATAASLS